MRIDRHLVTALPELSRSRIQQLIRSGSVRLNGAITRPHQLVRTGDQIEHAHRGKDLSGAGRREIAETNRRD